MPNFEFSDTSTFASDDTLSVNDFKRGGSARSVRPMWKMLAIVSMIVGVVGMILLGFWVYNLKKKGSDETGKADFIKKLTPDSWDDWEKVTKEIKGKMETALAFDSEGTFDAGDAGKKAMKALREALEKV